MPSLVFLHIPKTAGTTLHKVLTHQYHPKNVFIHHDIEGPPPRGLLAELKRDDGREKLVLGHVSARFHKEVPDVRYITCLRHPVGRLRSHFEHAKADPNHYLHTDIIEGKLSLIDYARSGLSGELSNGAVRMLAGVEDFDQSMVDDRVLKIAIKNLENYGVGVCLTERFDQTLMMIAENLAWKSPWYVRRKVGSYQRDKLDAGTRSAIEEANRFDLMLYEWAEGRVDEELEARGEDFQRLVKRFECQNTWRGRIAFLGRELSRRFGFQVSF